jgi:hypothetical protein
MPEKVEDHDVSDGESENEHEYDEMDTSPDVKDQKMTEHASKGENGEVKKKYDPKDPLRPRRKKARRACFACQRAHLTCGKYSWCIVYLALASFAFAPPGPHLVCLIYAKVALEWGSRVPLAALPPLS